MKFFLASLISLSTLAACHEPIDYIEPSPAQQNATAPDPIPAPAPTTTLHSVLPEQQTLKPATRVSRPDRIVPVPSDAVCVDKESMLADPAGTLNNLMLGSYGPIGQWILGDMGGAVQFGGPYQWAFNLGDSLIGVNDGFTVPSNWTFINNAMLIQSNECFWVEFTGGTTPSSLIPGNADGSYYWPLDSLVAGNTMYTFVTQIRSTGGTGMFAFEAVDIDLAVFDLSKWPLSSGVTVIESGPWDLVDSTRLEGIWFIRGTPGEQLISFQYGSDTSKLGLAKMSDPFDVTEPWELWDGGGWSTTSSPVFNASFSGESANTRPFLYNATWYIYNWSWSSTGFNTRLYSAQQVSGPYTLVVTKDATPVQGFTDVGIQYGHGVIAGYPLPSGAVLSAWSNNNGLDTGMHVSRGRPSFEEMALV